MDIMETNTKLSDRHGNGVSADEEEEGCCQCSLLCWRRTLRKNALMLVTMAAIVLGLAVGFGVRPLNPSYDVIAWISIWGELFMRMLQLIILPLIMACLVVGVSSMERGAGGRLGVTTLLYVLVTQVIAVVLGIVMAAAIRPGAGFGDTAPPADDQASTSYTDVFADLLRNLIPDNIVKACLQSAYTSADVVEPSNGTLATNGTYIELTRKLMYRDRMNTLGVVVFSLVLGAATSMAGEAGRPLRTLFESVQEVILKLMTLIIWYSPFGIASLIAGALLRVPDLTHALTAVGMFVVTSCSGCLIHQFVILPLIYLVFVRKNPFKLFVGLLDGILAGTAATSGSVALPYMMTDCTEKFHLDEQVVNFSLPIFTALNRDGSALFICVATIFCAQSYGISLSIINYFVIGLLVTLLVAAAAAVPSSSIVVLIMVAGSVGVPITGRLGLIMAVEWLTDRVRSSANITSHGYGVAIVERLCRGRTKERTTGSQQKLGDDESSKSADQGGLTNYGYNNAVVDNSVAKLDTKL